MVSIPRAKEDWFVQEEGWHDQYPYSLNLCQGRWGRDNQIVHQRVEVDNEVCTKREENQKATEERKLEKSTSKITPKKGMKLVSIATISKVKRQITFKSEAMDEESDEELEDAIDEGARESEELAPSLSETVMEPEELVHYEEAIAMEEVPMDSEKLDHGTKEAYKSKESDEPVLGIGGEEEKDTELEKLVHSDESVSTTDIESIIQAIIQCSLDTGKHIITVLEQPLKEQVEDDSKEEDDETITDLWKAMFLSRAEALKEKHVGESSTAPTSIEPIKNIDFINLSDIEHFSNDEVAQLMYFAVNICCKSLQSCLLMSAFAVLSMERSLELSRYMEKLPWLMEKRKLQNKFRVANFGDLIDEDDVWRRINHIVSFEHA